MSEQTNSAFNRISRQLEDYLDKKTHNAILLTASWGAGKTHYIKGVFFEMIKEKRYKKAYISLFGVNSVDDIKERIFLEIYPLLGNKKLKTGTTIFKAILKSIDVTKLMTTHGLVGSTLDNIEEVGTALKDHQKDAIDLGKLVICFDDLERVNPDLLSENQILGYINSLVEDDNIKVVIIANEPEIKDTRYQIIKEKVIANTIHFSQEFNETFNSILKDLEVQETSKYVTHLRLAAPTIYNFLLKENGQNINYRTLSYFLAYYQPVWRSIQKGTGIADLDEKRVDILDYLLKFTLFICVEYKKGAITYHQPAGLDAGTDFHIRKILNENLKASENAVDQLIASYFQKEDYIFYRSIFNYLTGGDYFNDTVLIQELCSNYHVQNQNISPSYKVFNTLSAITYNQLSDQNYLKLVRALKDHALKGHFLIRDYLAVFYYIFRFGNVLALDKEEMVEKFSRSIQKTSSWQAYEPMLDRYFSSNPENEFHQEYMKLYKVMKEVNLTAKRREKANQCHQVEQQLMKDFDDLYKAIIAEYQAQNGMTITLCNTRANIFFRVFKNAANKQKNEMIGVIRILFEHYFGEMIDEIQYLHDLYKLNNAHLTKNPPKNISGELHRQLHGYLIEFLEKRGLNFPNEIEN